MKPHTPTIIGINGNAYILHTEYADVLDQRNDLLEALERAVRSGWLSIDHDWNRTPEACEIRSLMCAAIDKARGQS